MTATTKSLQTTTDDSAQPETPADPATTDATPEAEAESATTLSPRQQAFALSQAESAIAADTVGDADGDDDFDGTFAAVPPVPGEFQVPLSALGEWVYHARFGSRQQGEHFAALALTAAEPDHLDTIVVLPAVDGVHPIFHGRFTYFALKKAHAGNEDVTVRCVLCGVCGGSWNVRTAIFWGCGSRVEGSGCTNNRTISTESYERRVLAGLRERMLDPDLVEVFVAEYREEHAKRASQMRRERGSAERRLANATATIDRLVAAVGSGAGTFEQFRDALNKARVDREAALAELQDQDALPVVALHPAIAADYRRQVANLQAALADPEAGPQAATALRALIDRIVLTPNTHGRGVSIQVEGRLAGIVALATRREPPESLTVKVERVKGIEPSS